MPVVFYIVGCVGLLGSIACIWIVFSTTMFAAELIPALSFMHSQDVLLALGVGLGIASLIAFSTGAIIETLRRQERE